MRKVLIPVAVIALAIAAAAIGGRSEDARGGDRGSCAKANLNARQGRPALDRHRQPGLPAVVRRRRDEGPAVEDQRPGQGPGLRVGGRVRGREAARLHQERRSSGSTRPSTRRSHPGKKSFDFDINQISYTPERAKALAFSASYYNVNQSIVGLKGKPISSVRSIAGLQASTSSARSSGRRATSTSSTTSSRRRRSRSTTRTTRPSRR